MGMKTILYNEKTKDVVLTGMSFPSPSGKLEILLNKGYTPIARVSGYDTVVDAVLGGNFPNPNPTKVSDEELLNIIKRVNKGKGHYPNYGDTIVSAYWNLLEDSRDTDNSPEWKSYAVDKANKFLSTHCRSVEVVDAHMEPMGEGTVTWTIKYTKN